MLLAALLVTAAAALRPRGRGLHLLLEPWLSAPGQQEAAAGGIAPVLVAQLGRLLVEGERIAGFR